MSTLDVADCCETLEEARGVIRRMETRIAALELQIDEIQRPEYIIANARTRDIDDAMNEEPT